MPLGPQKIILIRSGRYDYAEVDLDGSLQIVGSNNTGKTTLINTLQFLYLDDLRRTDFGAYSHEQTRAYYFPGAYSYILFQCLGAAGQCLLGWRGQSPASGNDPERFTCGGPYDPADFLDEHQRVREPRDVSARLAAKHYRVLKSAQEHRELLLPAVGGDGRGLGLVALKDPDRYAQFRESLKDLLSLSTITQDQMRDRLLMLADIPADRVALDMRQVFGEDYDRIRQRRDALVRFKHHAAGVERLIARFQDRESLRGGLVYRWSDLRARRQAFIQAHDAQLAQLRDAIAAADQRIEAHRHERQDRQQERDGFQRQLGALQAEQSALATQELHFADFVDDLARATLANLQAETTRLKLQLAEAERETRERAEQKLALYRDLVRRNQETIAHFDHLVVTALRPHFSDPELESLFSLLDPRLLECRVGPPGVQVRDEAALLATLRRLLERVRGEVYADATVQVPLSGGRAAVAGLANPDAVRARLADEQETLQRWERVLQAILEREAVARRVRELTEQEATLLAELLRFEQFQKARADAPRLRAETEQVTTAITAVSARLEALDRQIRDAEREQRDADTAIRQAEAGFSQTENRFAACHFPEFATAARTVEGLPDDFDAAVALFLHDQDREESLSGEVTTALHELEAHLGDRYAGADEAGTLANLQAELEALPEHEEALARDWNAHLHSLKSGFDHVLKELGEVHGAKDRLNRDMARVQISNLKSVRLEVLEAGDVVAWIRRLAAMEQPGLFDDATRLDQALTHFRRVLEANPVLRYASLFVLRFTVVGEDGQAHHHQDFRQIESHGTTITIKVLFNLLVLKCLLRRDDCQVPFFLDEVQSLDPANRQAILTTARKLGFIAITAAPDAITEVEALYFLLPQQGRIVLTPRHRYAVHSPPRA